MNQHFTKNNFFPDFVESKFDKLIFIKNYWDAAWGIVASPLSLIGNTLTALTFLKVFGLWRPSIIIPFFVVFVIGFLLFGLVLYRKGWITRINSFNNKFNQELQEILKNTKH